MSMMMSLILKFVDSPKTQTSKHLESESYKRLWYGKKIVLVEIAFNVKVIFVLVVYQPLASNKKRKKGMLKKWA